MFEAMNTKEKDYRNARRLADYAEKRAQRTGSTQDLLRADKAEEQAQNAWHALTGRIRANYDGPSPDDGWTDHDERALRSNGTAY